MKTIYNFGKVSGVIVFIFFATILLNIQSADAQIVYKKFSPAQKITVSDTSFTINFFNDTLNYGDVGNIVFRNNGSEIVHELWDGVEALVDEYGDPLALDKGFVIDSTKTTWKNSIYEPLNQNGYFGNWLNVKSKYVALRTQNGGQWYYGWARLDVDQTPTYFTIYDYAYNSVPDSSIKAGDDGTGIPKTPVIALSSTSINFSYVTIGSNGSQILNIANTGDTLLKISSISITNDISSVFSIVSNPGAVNLKPGDSIKLTVKFTPKSAKSYTGILVVKSNATNSATMNVPLSGIGTSKKEPQISLDSQSLSFGDVESGKTKDLSVQVTNSGDTSLVISAMNITNDSYGVFSVTNFSGNDIIFSKSSKNYTIRFSPGSVSNCTAILKINSNAVNSAILNLSLSGNGVTKKVPKITLDVQSLSYGLVKTNKTKDMTFKITNTGDSALTVSNITISNDASGVFSITDFSGSEVITNAGLKTHTVKFSPKNIKDYTAILTITSNDPNSGTVTINLSGSGEDPNSVGDVINISDMVNIVPNPVSANTVINIQKQNPGYSDMILYSLTGAKAETVLTNSFVDAGLHTFNLNTSNLSSGMYILEFSCEGKTISAKMIVP